MRWSNNDSGLSAKRSVFCTLTALAVCLVSCKTTQLPPLDDAYYWPEKNTPSNHQSSIINQQSSIINHQSTIINPQSSIINHQSSIINQQSPIIEYLNVQDTTVTVRIKR